MSKHNRNRRQVRAEARAVGMSVPLPPKRFGGPTYYDLHNGQMAGYDPVTGVDQSANAMPYYAQNGGPRKTAAELLAGG